jgi:hemerythrin-like metal-binding protein
MPGENTEHSVNETSVQALFGPTRATPHHESLLAHWDQGYSVTIPTFDEQHQGLFSRINALFGAILHGKDQEETDRILAELRQSTVDHFQAEEDLFALHPYADADPHRAAHAALLRKMEEIKTNIDTGVLTDRKDLPTFLKLWHQNHILSQDRQFCRFLTERCG